MATTSAQPQKLNSAIVIVFLSIWLCYQRIYHFGIFRLVDSSVGRDYV